MVGSIHPFQTVELLLELRRMNYNSAIYFDTFPDVSGLDPVEETRTNIEAMHAMNRIVDRLIDDKELQAATAQQDSPTTQRIVAKALYGS